MMIRKLIRAVIRNRVALLLAVLAWRSSLLTAEDLASERARSWHQWRGPEANGVAPFGDPPH